MSLVYWTSAAAVLGRNVFRDLVSPSRRFAFTRSLLCSGILFEAQPKLPSRHFLDLFPQAEQLTFSLGNIRYRRSNANPYEIYCLTAITALANPRRIFEIGTFDGATTLRFAEAAPAAEVFTLDLPLSTSSHTSELPDERGNIDIGGVGQRYRGTPSESRITQLFGDSRTFDYARYHGSCDLVFVDACHDYEFARTDSHSALKLLCSGGTIIWHDYIKGWPGVVKAVDELLPTHNITHITGTSLAILQHDVK